MSAEGRRLRRAAGAVPEGDRNLRAGERSTFVSNIDLGTPAVVLLCFWGANSGAGCHGADFAFPVLPQMGSPEAPGWNPEPGQRRR